VTKCCFEFQADEWDEPLSGQTERLPAEWACPHSALDSRDYCAFHAADVSPSIVRDAFHAALVDGTAETNAFVGATLPDLELASEEINVQAPLDFRAVTFTDTFDLEDTRFHGPVRFEGSHFCERLELDDTRFEDEVTFYGCRFDGVVEGNGTTFEQNAYFIGAEFSYSLLLKSRTRFEGDVFFTGTTFQSAAEISNAIIDGQAFFREVEFHGRTCFDRSVFYDDARFAGATFSGSLSIEHAHVHGVLQFGGTGINRHYDAATFACPLTIEHTDCERSAYFVECTFEDEVNLIKSTFNGTVDLSRSTFSDTLDLTRSTITDITLTPQERTGSVFVDGTQTIIHAGHVCTPSAGALFCHFEQATIGPVEFTTGRSTENDSPQLDLSWVRFIETTFSGFQFTRYRQCLEPDWQLHKFAIPAPIDDSELPPISKEVTYMRAKSGSNEIGDNRAAGAFFKQEMRARGARHKQQLLTTPSLARGYQYIGNRAFWLSSNYAESPQRVLGNSLALIAVFAVVYAGGFHARGFPVPYDAPVLGYVLLSGESFVTLVHSPAARIPTAGLRAVSIFEAFLGAFAIALFLFTLTRAVHR
jgi:hypothetical protein